MAVQVLSNNLFMPTVGAAVQQAVLAAIGAPNGDWTVQIHENQNSPSWHITIWGPNEFKWTREFFGLEEQNPLDGFAFIRQTISKLFSALSIKPVVFLSYAPPDNADGFVMELRKQLIQELRVQTGEPAEVLLDTDRMGPGAAWSKETERLVESAALLIPLVSPSYVKSEGCRKELEVFLERERQTRQQLVFPVYFVDTKEFENLATHPQMPWSQPLKSRNIADLRKHRFDLTSITARRIVAFLARSISDAFFTLASVTETKPAGVSRRATTVGETLYIESLRLKDFRCFDRLELRFDHQSRLEGKWTCIAGINGSGKSSILQAIGVALLGHLAADLKSGTLNRMRRLADPVNRGRAEVEVVLRAADYSRLRLPLEIDEGRIVSQGSPAPSWDRVRQLVVVGYGATRNLSTRVDYGNEGLSPDVRRQITLFDPLSQLAGAEVLLARQPASRPLLSLFQNLLAQVFDTELQIETDTPEIRFTVGGRDLVDAVDLPDGFRAAAAWLADLCAAWCERAPDIAANGNPADIQAIVLIDEIELHLHPALQRKLVPKLRAAMPKVQWIVTTHSPLVLANFDSNEIIALDRNEEGGIRHLDRQILGFSSDQIYEWLMGTEPTGEAIEGVLEKNEAQGEPTDDEVAELLETSPSVTEPEARAKVQRLKTAIERLKP